MLALLPRPEHEALAAARAREGTVDGKRLYVQRNGVEGTFSQAVRGFGLRRVCYRGLSKTGLQHVATAAAPNLDRRHELLRYSATPLLRVGSRFALRDLVEVT